MGKVVFISGTTAGDALAGAGRVRRQIFERLGHQFIEINFAQEGAIRLLEQVINAGGVDFAFTLGGIMTDLTATMPDGSSKNGWELSRIPLISIQGDTPAYYFDRHISLPMIANIYAFPEHHQFRRRLPQVNGILGVSPLHAANPLSPHDMDIAAKRSGKIVFLKNGNDPKKLRHIWRQAFSPTHYGWLMDLADALVVHINNPATYDIDGIVVQYFSDKGLDVNFAIKLRLLFVAQLDDYLRRVKSTMMAEALLDFPIEIHGLNWDHVDFQGRRAILVPSADYVKSDTLIKEALAVLDMSPNTGQLPHERAMRSFDFNTLCLTNEQQFFQENFSQHAEFSFRFEPESLRDRVADVLDRPEKYVELGVEVSTEYQRRYPAEHWGVYMQDVAAMIRANAATGMQGGQPYFKWPPNLL